MSPFSTSEPLGVDPGNPDPNSHTVEIVTTIVAAVVVAAGLVVTIRYGRAHRAWVGPLMLVGAAIASVQEPMVDAAGNMFIPDSHITAFTTYGREIPVFVVLAYAFMFGLQGFAYYTAAVRGSKHRFFVRCLIFSVGLELLVEFVAIHGGYYRYYGEQGPRIWELPLHWITLNMVPAWLCAAVLFTARRHLTGRNLLAAPLFVSCVITASYYASGWPVFAAMHADDPVKPLLWTSSLLSVAIGACIIAWSVKALSSPAPRMRESTPDGVADPLVTDRRAAGTGRRQA